MLIIWLWFESNSEQHLVDCDTSNNGCSGGWYDDAWEFMKDGAILEDKYRPYSAAVRWVLFFLSILRASDNNSKLLTLIW